MEYMLGYGSLLSQYSRQTHSDINGQARATSVTGWSRSWCAAYPDEGATYAGAVRNSNSALDAVLIPTQLDIGLRERERNYRFIRIAPSDLSFFSVSMPDLNDAQIWLCESTNPQAPTLANPLPQTYVDTCLIGCIETGGEDAARQFIKQTLGWDSAWLNDRLHAKPIYPRHTPLSSGEKSLVDDLLAEQDVLKYRTNP
ncbi:MAG: hypothetical protein ACI9FR_000517 [Cryomorphaceae bacterium]|jgi:hypothetical protein